MKLFVRTVRLSRARVKICMANLAYNFTRRAWLEARARRPELKAIPQRSSAAKTHTL